MSSLLKKNINFDLYSNNEIGIILLKILRLLLNKRNSSSMESVLSAFSELAQLAVRKVYTLSGKKTDIHFNFTFIRFD